MSSRFADVELQLSELEMLQSMYPEEGEIVLCDLVVHSELRRFIEESGDDPLRLLIFVLKLRLEEQDCVFHIEFSPPLNYPSQEKISALIRSPDMSKSQYTNINKDLKHFVEDLHIGETHILQIIEWINEHGQDYVSLNKDEIVVEEQKTSEPQSFSRIWIYSHHIYNKVKRKNILEWSKELNLTGFSMPGKPGIVCVEGPSKNCEEFWLRMRRQTWKRLSLAHREDGVVDSCNKTGTFVTKFHDPVCEMDFGVHGGRDYHMDLGQFATFLARHQSHEVFSLLFGVEGKVKE